MDLASTNPIPLAKPSSTCQTKIYQIAEPEIQRIKQQCTTLDGVNYITSYDCSSVKDSASPSCTKLDACASNDVYQCDDCICPNRSVHR